MSSSFLSCRRRMNLISKWPPSPFSLAVPKLSFDRRSFCPLLQPAVNLPLYSKTLFVHNKAAMIQESTWRLFCCINGKKNVIHIPSIFSYSHSEFFRLWITIIDHDNTKKVEIRVESNIFISLINNMTFVCVRSGWNHYAVSFCQFLLVLAVANCSLST